ncbi:MAG: hypothetical protein JNJ77_11670 [Planctomycetia bacterium]|nr:hypothetical protein [Planctomycetia bacterium]
MTRRSLLVVMFCWIGSTQLWAQENDQAILDHAARLKEIGNALQRPETIASQPEKHLENLRVLRQYRLNIDELGKKYGVQMRTNQRPWSDLSTAWNYASRELKEYERYAGMFASVPEIDALLIRILDGAKRGVEYKAPAYFKPGNDIQLGFIKAEQMLLALEALDPENRELARLKAELIKIRSEVNSLAATMRNDIIAGNTPPPDEYRNSDRAALLQLLQEKWSKEGNGQKVLKAGIITSQWTRSITWQRVGSEWQRSDKSRIQGYVITQLDNQLAVRHTLNLSKDHLSHDKISVSLLNDPKAEPELINLLSISKVK